MKAPLSTLRERLEEVRERIACAAERAGRAPQDVVLVGVVKTVPVDQVAQAIDLGLKDLGESRVQEADARIAAIGRARARWHLVGHLQSNKAGRAVELFDRIHSLDRASIADVLSRRAVAAGVELPVLVEVNVSGEATKFGAAPAALRGLVEHVAGLPGLRLDGLMTVGAPVTRPKDAQPGFAALRTLAEQAQAWLGRRLPELSMGMSGDYEVAIEEGATLVRVGSALFGARA